MLVSFGLLLAMVMSNCGSTDSVSTIDGVPPTPRPVPTVPGRTIEVEVPPFVSEPIVVGLASGQNLEVRLSPGFEQPVLGQVRAGADGLRFLGEVFETDDDQVWWMVNYETLQGWIPRQVALPGPAEDITADVTDLLGSSNEFESPEALAAEVAAQIGNREGAPDIAEVERIEVAGEASTTITVDLLGIEDDSLLGYRVIINADGRSRADGSWIVGSVQQLPLCSQGVTIKGLCT